MPVRAVGRAHCSTRIKWQMSCLLAVCDSIKIESVDKYTLLASTLHDIATIAAF